MQQNTEDQPTPQPTPPPETPHPAERRKPSDAEMKSARTAIRRFLVLAVLALLCSGLPLPTKIAAPVLGLAAVVMAIVALIKAVRAGLPLILRVSLAVGLVISLILTVGTSLLIAIWPITTDYETCKAQALTERAAAQCEQGYQDRLDELTGNLGG